MEFGTVLFLIFGALSGGFINGLSGTGTALFALGFYLMVLQPVTAVAIVALMAVLSGFQGLWLVRSDITRQRARVLRFVVPGLIGVPVGLSLLGILDAAVLRLVVAALLIIYGGYFGFRKALPALSRSTPAIDAGVGVTAGILGGAAGLSGVLPTMWLSMRAWGKSEIRAVLQSYNMVILLTTVGLLAMRGAYDRTAFIALAITIPTGLCAAQIGIAVFRGLSDGGFRRLLVLLCLVLGFGILFGELI